MEYSSPLTLLSPRLLRIQVILHSTLFPLPNLLTLAFVRAPQEDFSHSRFSKDAYIRAQKFTRSASSTLIHAFSHAFHTKSLLILTLLSKLILPFLPPSPWVDDQSMSLAVELLFFHIEYSIFHLGWKP